MVTRGSCLQGKGPVSGPFLFQIRILWDSQFYECSRNIVRVRGNKLLQVPTGRQSGRCHPDLAQESMSVQEMGVLCHKRTAVVSLRHAGHRTEDHDIIQLLRDNPEGRIPVRGQDRIPVSPRDGVGHVFPLPSPPLREDVDRLHVGGDLPRQEGAVQRAAQSSPSTSGTAEGTLRRTWRHG